ncbi:hypothetical protein [Tropicimonas marinistellae]|uniref:hypothetical protein n=1 Tax=Tropicimonas marinistellae TaxID=1739787 RepID=UPI0008359A5B|nr:hypothetical protein [Tropicimonas marinistellae]
MTGNGWISAYRAIWDHSLFQGDAERVGVWLWMLMRATWRERRFKSGGEIFNLQRGQVCVSQSQICQATGVSRKRLRTLLRDLEADGAIVIEPANGSAKGRSIITIVNYREYQGGESGEGQAGAKAAPTNKRNKNSSSEEEGATRVVSFAVSKILFDVVAPGLVAAGTPEASARSMIGKWRKDGRTDAEILAAFETAQKSGAAQPLAYMSAILCGGKSQDRVGAKAAGKVERVDSDKMTIEAIRDGKRYLLSRVTAAKARRLIAEDRVTEEQCRTVGLI